MDSSFSKNQTPEELVSQFKRQGMLDQMRRSLYKDLTENEIYDELKKFITETVDDEVTTSPGLLMDLDRRKAAGHIENVISRQSDKDVYKAISEYIDNQTINNEQLQQRIRDTLTKPENGNEK